MYIPTLEGTVDILVILFIAVKIYLYHMLVFMDSCLKFKDVLFCYEVIPYSIVQTMTPVSFRSFLKF